MKRYVFLSVLAVSVAASFVISCKKDDEFVLTGCRILRAYGSDSSYNEVIYDGARIQKYYYKRKNGTILNTHNYNYTSTGKISAIFTLDSTGSNLSVTEYQYDSQDRVLTEVYYTYPGGVLTQTSYYAYTYYSNGRVQTASRYTLPGGIPTLQETYYYTEYDANGNNTKGYMNNALGTTIDTFYYSYDDKPYPYQFTFYQLQFHNNVLEYREKYNSPGPDYVVTYTYTYNSQGYPVTRYYVQQMRTERIDYECGN